MFVSRVSTGTAIAFVVKMNIDRVAEFAIKFFCFLLCKCTPGDDWMVVSDAYNDKTMRNDLPSKACSTLRASLALVSK